tara:strand:+ start:1584 stop:1823 length:240 start_codon:yes stop_codon:yes gene_type:complete
MSRLKDKYGKKIDNYHKWKNPIGILELWVIIFIALKVTNVIDWSWWWVLAPWWIPMLFVSFVFFGVILGLTIKFFWNKS